MGVLLRGELRRALREDPSVIYRRSLADLGRIEHVGWGEPIEDEDAIDRGAQDELWDVTDLGRAVAREIGFVVDADGDHDD